MLRNKSRAIVGIINKERRLFLVRGALSRHVEGVVVVLMRRKGGRVPLRLLTGGGLIVELLLSTRIVRGLCSLLPHSQVSLDLLVLHCLSLS